MLARTLAIVTLVAIGSGCGDELFDCRDICSTVQSCISVDIDVSDCTGRCDNFANSSADAEFRVEQCNDCLDTRACGQAADCRDFCDFLL
jgi:hypothetical protein